MLLQTSNKKNVILCSAMLYLYINERCYAFKGQVWEAGASLVVQTIKNLSAMHETWVRSLGQEDPLEKGIATHSSILA